MVSSFRISRLDEEEGERHRKIRENKERLSILRVSYESLTRENRKRNHASSISLAVLIREDWIQPRTPSYYETISSAGLAMFPTISPLPSRHRCTCFRANSNFLAARKPFRGARPGKQGVNEQSGPFDNISPFTVSRSFFYPLPLRPERIHRKELSSAV